MTFHDGVPAAEATVIVDLEDGEQIETGLCLLFLTDGAEGGARV